MSAREATVRTALAATMMLAALGTGGVAAAEPEPVAPDPVEAVAAQPVAAPLTEAAPGAAPAEAAPPDGAEEGPVASSPPETTTAPDGTTLTVSAKDETQSPVAPLTTAISTREYAVGGVFNGTVDGPGSTPKGVFEVGYQIGCGIDMSTSNGVSMTGTAGISPSIGFLGLDFPNIAAEGILPGVAGTFNGAVTVGLKPGFINVVPVTKKQYAGTKPWVSITNFRVKIDGCVGESFIRSYAILTRSTDEGDAILSWYGVTKAV